MQQAIFKQNGEETKVDKIYWYLEYMKVLAAYAALLYIWPSIIFHKYLRGKGLEFRFLFCSVVQIVLVNLAVLGAGLLHILNAWAVRALFYGPLIVNAAIFLVKRKSRDIQRLALWRGIFCWGNTDGNFFSPGCGTGFA